MTRPRRIWLEVCQQCGSSFRPHASKATVYCRDCSPNRSAYDRIKNYGVDQEMFNAMYFEVDGTCPICLSEEATCVDHCHRTGKVRGILGQRCNKALGWFEDSVGSLGRAVTYLEESS